MIANGGNIFAELPQSISDEVFQEIIHGERFRLERIISFGQATPGGQWYDQERDRCCASRWNLLVWRHHSEWAQSNANQRVLLGHDRTRRYPQCGCHPEDRSTSKLVERPALKYERVSV
jgi:hypothetical protein